MHELPEYISPPAQLTHAHTHTHTSTCTHSHAQVDILGLTLPPVTDEDDSQGVSAGNGIHDEGGRSFCVIIRQKMRLSECKIIHVQALVDTGGVKV